MGSLDDRLRISRKQTPSPRVEGGSVAIAGLQTGIYPFPSPGGWHVIGNTPLRMFDKTASPPCMLEEGDEVTFFRITAEEYRSLNSGS
jgi:inhibitor of KinA